MRRFVCLSSAAAVSSLSVATAVANSATLTAVPARFIYTTWGSVPCEDWARNESWLKRITSQSDYRSFEFWHVPQADVPAGLRLNAVERYLLSSLENDTDRLLHVSWCEDFDPYWHDRVGSLEMLYKIVYTNDYPLYRYIFGNCMHKVAEKEYMLRKLNYLKSVLFWAGRTERCYTSIVKARYYVQRCVWNALERERYLCACVEAVDSFGKKVPEELRQKVMPELEVALVSMRHWVWDCPNGKRTFTRRLA
ncbi:conserved hypothetical protein [Leishmania braziliensis MHOM/BR/75/M2904]|uniref:Uncharacterized protein n=3 Tax=Viannia TaxID=37616 RepID=A4HI59_LEIBR|nr:conserved hypothetical protein [Leishmania braziliensis MHOM/BR/75/M2904]KAI5689701.1 hypothetical protein MNV84_05863 [Leishmania braziliensis]CAJ2477089.1 unnamed protein product [Leishmania braziliensis]CAJ2477565.1 unnamed protein product [Leishmania braziliensis]CAM40265.1 conserved hypothetical protein [Leishmania braziliensis MHOM/BR/75/M2904]SYZ67925.1 hypothetical_protein [Leishmania braziliensis MHOM/BR/75/M2904]